VGHRDDEGPARLLAAGKPSRWGCGEGVRHSIVIMRQAGHSIKPANGKSPRVNHPQNTSSIANTHQMPRPEREEAVCVCVCVCVCGGGVTGGGRRGGRGQRRARSSGWSPRRPRRRHPPPLRGRGVGAPKAERPSRVNLQYPSTDILPQTFGTVASHWEARGGEGTAGGDTVSELPEEGRGGGGGRTRGPASPLQEGGWRGVRGKAGRGNPPPW